MRNLAPSLRLALMSATLATPAVAQSLPDSPYRLRAEVDAPLLVAGVVLWIAPASLVRDQVPGPPCDPCDPATVNPFDRPFIRGTNPDLRLASNLLLAAVGPIWIGLELTATGLHHPRDFFTDVAVLAESLAWAGVVDEIFRRSVHRPRPFMYVPDAYPSDRKGAEAGFSYYSGHVSAIFAFAVSTGYGFTLHHPGSRFSIPVWSGLMALGTVEALLRVASGDHFPTDVIVGALVGSSIGLLIPALHRRGPLPVTLAPSTNAGGAGVAISGRF